MKVLGMIDKELICKKTDNETVWLKMLFDFLKVVNFPYSNEKYLLILLIYLKIGNWKTTSTKAKNAC